MILLNLQMILSRKNGGSFGIFPIQMELIKSPFITHSELTEWTRPRLSSASLFLLTSHFSNQSQFIQNNIFTCLLGKEAISGIMANDFFPFTISVFICKLRLNSYKTETLFPGMVKPSRKCKDNVLMSVLTVGVLTTQQHLLE